MFIRQTKRGSTVRPGIWWRRCTRSFRRMATNRRSIISRRSCGPMSAEEKAMVAKAAKRLSEAQAKKLLSIEHWVHDVNWEKALELLMSRPTVNIEGLVG